MAPLQLLSIPIFLKFGQVLTHSPPIEIRPTEIVPLFFKDMGHFFAVYGMVGLRGVLVWALAAPFVFGVIYVILNPVLSRLFRKVSS